MTTLEDLKKQGFTANDNGTLNNPQTGQRLDVYVGDTGQVYGKIHGANDVYNRIDA